MKTRAEIEKAAREEFDIEFFTAEEHQRFADFAIQQVNAALEGAAMLVELPSGVPTVMDLDGLDDLADAIRNLKIA